MAEYYRNWNLVVHDWLYAYVYRDVGKVGVFYFFLAEDTVWRLK